MLSIFYNVEIDLIKDVFFDDDLIVVECKKDYIELVFKSQIIVVMFDECFYYELFLVVYLMDSDSWLVFEFLGKNMCFFLWVLSMIGGMEKVYCINYNFVWVCCEFGMGMGLGFCCFLLYSDECLEDFVVCDFIGDE